MRLALQKQARRPGNTWPSLLAGQYAAAAAVLDDMEKKMTLERFQREVRADGKAATLHLTDGGWRRTRALTLATQSLLAITPTGARSCPKRRDAAGPRSLTMARARKYRE